jgi:hypothetical protein
LNYLNRLALVTVTLVSRLVMKVSDWPDSAVQVAQGRRRTVPPV